MSALDFGARALAARSAAQTPQSFTQLAKAQLPANVARIESVGHSKTGIGTASYIADDLATASLAASHPSAVFQGEGGRFFRLNGTPEGYVTPEMFGCPPYAPGVNQQPYIQAALSYAAAVGLQAVVFTQKKYELWMPPRKGGLNDYDDLTGHFLVSSGVSLISTHPKRTKLHCKGPKGGNLLTDYQEISNPYANAGGDAAIACWRGAGLFLTNTAKAFSVPDEDALHTVLVSRIRFVTDAIASLSHDWPATKAKPNCWDTSNKGIWFQHAKQHSIVYVQDVDIVGFLGECIYTTGTWAENAPPSGVVGRNIYVAESNGQALNPNGPPIFDIDGLVADRCAMAIEGWIGWKLGRIVNACFKNCVSGGGIAGSNGYAMSLRSDGQQPVAYIDLKFENCGGVYIGPYTKGTIRAIDTTIRVQPPGNAPVKDVDLTIYTEIHNRSLDAALTFYPFAGRDPAETAGNKVRIHVSRTREAVAAGYAASTLLQLAGAYGAENEITISGNPGNGVLTGINSNTPITDQRVKIIADDLATGSMFTYREFDGRTGGYPEFQNPLLRPRFYGESGLFSMGLPDVSKFTDGHTVTIAHIDDASPNAVLMIDNRVVLGFKRTCKLRANRRTAVWDLVEAPRPIRKQAALAVADLPLGAEAAYTVPVVGCRSNMLAEIVPPTSGFVTKGLTVTAVRPETDLVRFWIKNIDGASPATGIGSLTFTALVKGLEASYVG